MLVLRQSALNDFEVCSLMCKNRWKPYGEASPTDDEDTSANKYAMVGTAIHKTMEWFANQRKIDKKIDLDMMHSKLDGFLSVIPPEKFKNPEDALTMFESAHDQIEWLYEQNREIVPIVVEMPFHIAELFPGLPPFEGTIDRIDGNILMRNANMIDYKSGKVFTKKEMTNNIQATIYIKAFHKMFGFYPESFSFIFSRFKKVRTIYVSPEFLEAGEKRIRDDFEHIRQGHFYPNDKNKYFCKHFCTTTELCPLMQKKKGWEAVGYERYCEKDNEI